MADVVVNISGDATNLKNTLNNVANSTNIPNGGAVNSGGTTVTHNRPPQQPLPPRQGVMPSPNSSNNTPITPNGSTPAMPTYDRMAQDIRREILNRGVVMVPGTANFQQLLNTLQTQQKNNAFDAIEDKYRQRSDELRAKQEQEERVIKDDIDRRKAAALSNATDPVQRTTIEGNFDRVLNQNLAKINRRYAPLYDQLDEQELAEKANVEKDLAKVMQDLVNELKRGNEDSYLGKLRQSHREAIYKRDNANTEEEAIAASKEAGEIQKRIIKAMGGGPNLLNRISAGWGSTAGVLKIGFDAIGAYRRNINNQIDEINAAANGDYFGAALQDYNRRKMNAAAWGSGIFGLIGGALGGVGAAAGSLGIGTAAGIAGGATIGAGAGSWIGSSLFEAFYGGEQNQLKMGQLWASQEKRLNSFTNLAMMTRGNGNIDAERQKLLGYGDLQGLRAYETQGGLNIYDLGYTSDQAAQHFSQRIQQRGFFRNVDDAIFNSMNADALEKVYNMTSGSLNQLSRYDRYRGNDANQDFTNLVASLNRMGTLGMSGGQTLRANEFMSYQMQLMEMQKGWMNPNSEFAIRQLLAAQSAFGNNLDDRAISEIGQMNNAIIHPQDGYSKTLLYDVIQNEFKDTRGNLLAIRQKQFSNDPAVRERIQKAMFRRLTDMFGGVNTTSGYMALSQYTGIEDPDRLKAWVNRMQKGLPEITEGSIATATAPIKDYTPQVTKEMMQYQDKTVLDINENLQSLAGVADQMLSTFRRQLQEIVTELRK